MTTTPKAPAPTTAPAAAFRIHPFPADVLAQPGVVRIHSRNIDGGCYMFTVTRP